MLVDGWYGVGWCSFGLLGDVGCVRFWVWLKGLGVECLVWVGCAPSRDLVG